MGIELWTGFVMGILGSVHCIGMCGPIAAALPDGFSSRSRLLLSRVLYNMGRTFTYTALGALSGLIGQGIALIGLQRGLSIATGAIIVLAVLVPSRFVYRVLPVNSVARLTGRVKSYWGRMFQRGSLSALLVIGLLNGLLPCGFLYVGLAAAAATGSSERGAAYMLLFGLGTTPALLAVSLAGPLLGGNLRRRLSRLLPVGAVILGLLLMLRGMSLGIPYVSPNLERQQATQQPCCH